MEGLGQAIPLASRTSNRWLSASTVTNGLRNHVGGSIEHTKRSVLEREGHDVLDTLYRHRD